MDWSWEGPLPWLWGGAIAALLVDVMLNLGGVSVFTSRLTDTNIGQEQLAMSNEFVAMVSKFATFILALFFAVASELLDEFAVYSETGGGRAMGLRTERQKQYVKQQGELRQLLAQDSKQRSEQP